MNWPKRKRGDLGDWSQEPRIQELVAQAGRRLRYINQAGASAAQPASSWLLNSGFWILDSILPPSSWILFANELAR